MPVHPCLLLTDGAGPVRIVTTHWRRAVPVPAVRVVDTVGAGDAFGAGFRGGLARRRAGPSALRDNDAVETAVRFAIRVASWTVGRPGAALPTRADLGLPDPLRHGWATGSRPEPTADGGRLPVLA